MMSYHKSNQESSNLKEDVEKKEKDQEMYEMKKSSLGYPFMATRDSQRVSPEDWIWLT